MTQELSQFNLESNSFWTATKILPSWKGFQSRRGAYGSRDQSSSSDGSVEISTVPKRQRTTLLSGIEISSIDWIIENESSIFGALIESLVKAYPSLQEFYAYNGEKKTELMPDLKSSDDLRELLGLYIVYVHDLQKDGKPYAGFLFGCNWEQEHGLGILMHGTRTVEIGWAETAFVSIPKDDLAVPRTAPKIYPSKLPNWPPTSRKQGWVKTSGTAPYDLNLNKTFRPEEQFLVDACAQFSIMGPLISETEIDAVLPESFPGKDMLIEFYLRYNGGSRSPKGCVFHCGNPAHRISHDRLETLDLEGFYSIPLAAEDRMPPFANILRHHATMVRIYANVPDAKAFIEEHIAIAFDHTGNDLCISRYTGRVFFMDWGAYRKGPVEIAQSFRDLVVRFWNNPSKSNDYRCGATW
jgi:hypothetical protein